MICCCSPPWKLFTHLLLALPLTLSAGAIAGPKKQPAPFQIKSGVPSPTVIVMNRVRAKKALLPAAEVQTIQTLQDTAIPRPVSHISPNATTVVMRVTRSDAKKPSFYFLNIHTGNQVEIARESFQDFEIDWMYWRDDQTVVAISSKNNQQETPGYTLLTINYPNGKVTSTPLQLGGDPTSIAPNGSQVLVQLRSPTQQGDSEDESTAADEPDENRPTEFQIVSLPDSKITYRFALPPGTTVYTSDWSRDGTKLALIQGWQSEIPSDYTKGGVSLSAIISRDVMGLLPPVMNPYFQKNALIRLDLKTGDRQIRYAADSDRAIFEDVAWSPDGQTILVHMLSPLNLAGRPYPIYGSFYLGEGFYRFYNLDLQHQTDLKTPELTTIDSFGITNGKFLTNDEVIFTVLSGMNIWLYAYDRKSGQLQALSSQPGSYERVELVPQQRQLIFRYSSFTEPPELYRMSLATAAVTQLTNLNKKIAETSQTRADPVSFQLSNGDTLDGVLVQPAAAPFPPVDTPLIVWQEGGPSAPMTNWWKADVETPYALLPNFGMAVLVVPVYGRQGFDLDRYARLYNGNNFGQVDIDAMAEIVKQAIARGYTSPGKVGITGCSYGGYFTLQSITRHPQLYHAANAQCSWVDMVADWAAENPLLPPFVFGNLTPYANTKEFQQDSPIYNAHRIRTPLLIFHGSNDHLPVTVLENLSWTMTANHVPVRMVKFMGAEHGLVDESGNDIPAYQLYAAQEMIQWFRTYLQPASTKTLFPSSPNQSGHGNSQTTRKPTS